MAVTFPTIAGASLGTLGSSTLSISKPTSTAAGELLVCYIICSANTVITPVESGWTTDVTAAGIRSYSRIAGGSEPSSYGFTRASNVNNIMGVIVRVSGADEVTPVDTLGSATGGSGTTVTLPDLTVTNGFTLLQIAEVLAATTFTPPSGPTELFDQQFATQNFTGAVGIETVGAGSTGTRVWTHGTGVRAGVMYALRAAPQQGGTLAGTVTLSASGVVGRSSDSSLAATASRTASGSADIYGGAGLGAVATASAVGAGAGVAGGSEVVQLGSAGRTGTASDSDEIVTTGLTGAGVMGRNGGGSLTATAALTADGTPGANADAAVSVGLSADYSPGANGSRSAVVALTASANVDTFAGATLAITAAADGGGARGVTGDGTLAVTVGIPTALERTLWFEPPTQDQAMPDHFWGRYEVPVGVSVVRSGDTFTTQPTPTEDELVAAGSEGTDFFRGGYRYDIEDEDLWEELAAAGFVESLTPGYGEGPYGGGGFGG